jgi:hypothetical protein
LSATRETTGPTGVWATCTASRDSSKRLERRIAKASTPLRTTELPLPISPTACSLCNASTKRGRQSSTRCREDWKITACGLLSMLWLFARGDSSSVADQQWFAGRPEENFGLSLVSDTAAYAGHPGQARELTKRSVDSAIGADSKEMGQFGWRIRPCARLHSATRPKPGKQQKKA